jgi:redox-sensitive bicupin YhaK (pirin superfamily)
VFVVGGQLKINGEELKAGDQARISGEQKLELSAAGGSGAGTPADFLLLDLP